MFMRKTKVSVLLFCLSASAACLGGTITGSGTTNYVPKFTDTLTIGNSNLYESGGKVGLGTTNPQRELHIANTGHPYMKIQSTDSTGAGIQLSDISEDWLIQAEGLMGNTGLAFYDVTASAYRVLIDNNGRVGVGTMTPDRELHIAATGHPYLKVQSTDSTGAGIQLKDIYEDWLIQAEGLIGNTGLAIYDNGQGQYRMLIDNAGNVGIGTITPSSKLQVAGTVHSTSGGFKFPDGTVQTSAASGYIPPGTIRRAYVTYNDSDTIDISAGNGECNGHYWEITSLIHHDMTSLAFAEDYHYIYIDDSESDYPTPTIIDSTTEPEWSDMLLGWYNGDDRCIGVVWNPGNATVSEFSCNAELKYMKKGNGYIKGILTNGDPSGYYCEIDASNYIPVNAISVFVSARNRDVSGEGTALSVLVGIHADGPDLTDYSYDGFAEASGWLELIHGSQRKIYWIGYNDDENLYCILIKGWQIER